ncbi:transposase [Virgibacillus sp. 179-BFC.A HS]|uniref:Transposase n=1 Tax=Tigheibacillus jepli TaxID=3035914 RepID=A0ABU5CEV0_9BACI|nr:transposase [Virgibacillus sp. 179-BFC.A HS]MDY0404254.1 transposase [Virgibacillus sp. 179-BFC.A HS]MDY0404419.1 transposase [Virgibacillus sp. 179-BFC.A HS]MDY0404850.1 transposase [Virgibacillus sp. 179-BFC.A HS]MDY0405494.1 transposase [Virgibacillus sp. 179-BFC.A HS]MDY0405581.1 transposase [Virgibacillus sp. 179-BFC.A HS]
MAIIPQMNLFSWTEIEELGDLDRLRLVIEYLPDDKLMRTLEKERKNGRDDYPIRVVWNTILAGVVFEHKSIESLIRELNRNAQLRWLCGIENGKVPPSYVYSRFMKKLIDNEDEIEAIFLTLVEQISEVLPDFGKSLAIDGKAIPSFANRKNKNEKEDGRRDTDADHGVKSYRGKREDGSTWEKIVRWFGYKLHLVVDAVYELPVFFSVTKASVPDINEAHKLLEKMKEKQPALLENAETMAGDKGYDDTKFIANLWDDHGIKPVIDIRNMWKDGESTRLLGDYENITHNYKGNVYCHCPVTGKQQEMANGGFEKDRDTLKKLCPAKQYGVSCEGMTDCPVAQGIRIKLEEDRRIFTPIDRASYKWETEYNKRTAVERVNSRLDVSFGFENHTIRGLDKMKVRCGLALCIMLAMALGRIKENQPEKIRSLVS